MTSFDADETCDLTPAPSSLVPDDGGAPPYLVLCSGTQRSAWRIPRAGALVVGRGRSAALTVDDATLSREHFAVHREPDGVRLVDLASQHGTTIDGVPVRGTTALRGGAIIRAGRSVFYFHDDDQRVAPPDHAIDGVSVWSTDPAMTVIHRQLQQLASSPLSVLVLGDTGTGKEVAARALHAWSPRASGPFVAINCAALPDTLIEAELFGYERGAFSGAHVARPGLFEVASGGTLFLDEIGELPLASQAKLLRVLETRRVQRLGDAGHEREVDVRVVAATHVKLASSSAFRRDLYFRLGGASVTLPPLCERPLDVVTLALAFLEQAAARAEIAVPRLGVEAMSALVAHRWPGNVRELKHLMDFVVASSLGSELGAVIGPRVVRAQLALVSGAPTPALVRTPTLAPAPVRARSIAPAPITPRDGPLVSLIPAAPRSISGVLRLPSLAPPRFRPIDDEIRELERRRMAAALEATGGNQTKAAELISMPRRTFLTKLKQYQLGR